MSQLTQTSVTAIILACALVAVFGSGIRMRLMASWVMALLLSFLFLALGNETLAFILSLSSTLLTMALISQTLVFGDFQRKRMANLNWRKQIVPITGALMLLALIWLGSPRPLIEGQAFSEGAHLSVSVLGSAAVQRFFIFSVMVASVAFGAVVGVGMIARSDWQKEKEGR